MICENSRINSVIKHEGCLIYSCIVREAHCQTVCSIGEIVYTEDRDIILESFSHGKEAKLVALIKLLCWGESMLEEKADFPKVSVFCMV